MDKKLDTRPRKVGTCLVLQPLIDPHANSPVEDRSNPADKNTNNSDSGSLLDSLMSQLDAAKEHCREAPDLASKLDAFEADILRAKEVYEKGDFNALSHMMFYLGNNMAYINLLPFVSTAYTEKMARYKGKEKSDRRFENARFFALDFAHEVWSKDCDPVPRLGQVVDNILLALDIKLKELGLEVMPDKQTVRGWIREAAPPEALKRGRPSDK